MILTGDKIRSEIKRGTIVITPFIDHLLNPNSYNYRLGSSLLMITDAAIDTQGEISAERIAIPKSGYILQPGQLYLGHTLESIGSDTYVPSLIGRSSLGRLGLFLQITANLGHVGTSHKWTLELKVVQPLVIYPEMRIGQVSFWQTTEQNAKDRGYKSYPNNYSLHSEPTLSKMDKFFA